MSAFEFLFSLFGLLLGFSIVEVLGGLARTIEARLRPDTTFRMGWLTPLLGLFVLLDLLSFWGSAWIARDVLTLNSAVLLCTFGFAGAYYLAAHLVFPHDPAGIADLDDHYWRVHRPVLLALVALLALQLAWFASVPSLAVRLMAPGVPWRIGLLAVLMLAAAATRNRHVAAVLLVALSLRYVIEAFG